MKNLWLMRARRMWIGAFAVTAIFFMFYAVNNYHATIGSLRITRPGMLLYGVFFHLLFWGLAAHFWQVTLKYTTGQHFTLRACSRQLALVAVGKYLPGKVWGFLARGTSLKANAASNGDIVSSALLEQWTMLMSALVVSGLLLPLTQHDVWRAFAVAAVLIGLCGKLVFSNARKILSRAIGFMTGSPAPDIGKTLSHSQYFHLLLLHSGMWLLLGCVLAAMSFAFASQPFTLELAAVLVLANTIGVVAGFAALFAPGGIGVREAAITAMLLPYMQLDEAAMLSVVFRLWTTMVDGVLALILVLRSTRN